MRMRRGILLGMHVEGKVLAHTMFQNTGTNGFFNGRGELYNFVCIHPKRKDAENTGKSRKKQRKSSSS